MIIFHLAIFGFAFSLSGNGEDYFEINGFERIQKDDPNFIIALLPFPNEFPILD